MFIRKRKLTARGKKIKKAELKFKDEENGIVWKQTKKGVVNASIETDRLVKLVKAIKGVSYPIFLQSAYWKEIRAIILKRDNYTCVCGNKQNLQVHHKTYKHHFQEHKFLKDLITLCKVCHEKEHLDKL